MYIALVIQGCRGYRDSYEDSHGYGMGTVKNSLRPVEIRWEFLNGYEIKRKRVFKYAINVIVDV